MIQAERLRKSTEMQGMSQSLSAFSFPDQKAFEGALPCSAVTAF